jgi:hypothetical protein
MSSVRRFLFVFIATVLTGGALMIGCGSSSGGGLGLTGECGVCTNTSDCESGYTCLNYAGTRRCGRMGYTCNGVAAQ